MGDYPSLEEIEATRQALIEAARARRSPVLDSMPPRSDGAPDLGSMPQAMVVPQMDVSRALAGRNPVPGSVPTAALPTASRAQETTLNNVLASKSAPDRVPMAPAVPGGTETSREQNERGNAETAVDQYLYDLPRGPGPSAPTVLDEGVNFLPGGGPEGAKNFNEAYVERPRQLESAIRDQQKAQEDLQAKKDAWYEAQMGRETMSSAIAQASRMRNQQEIAKRQADLDAATHRYANDLADTGRYWRDPGNIIAAIGASLMGLGGHAELGRKMINDAVERDYMQRKQGADMHLGALRSNLEGYRQLAGDRELGDNLAHADAYRIAAMDLQRISNQAQGPLMKAEAEKQIAQLMQTNSVLKMNAYAHFYNKPSALPAPIAESYKKTGRAMPGVGYTPFTSVQGAGAYGAKSAPPKWLSKYMGDESENGQSSGQGSGQGLQQARSTLQAMRAASGGSSRMDKVAAAAVNDRAPGTDKQFENYKALTLQKAMVMAGRAGRTNPDLVTQKYSELIEADTKAANEAAKLGVEKDAGSAKAWSTMKTDVGRVKAASAMWGKTPDEFLGYLRDVTPDSWASEVQKLRMKYGSQGTPEAKQAMQQLEASERFHQMLSGKIVDYYHSKFGGAMQKQELELGKGVIDPAANWSKIEGFADLGSQEGGRRVNAILDTLPPGASARLRLRYGLNDPGMDYKGYSPKKE